MKSAKAQSCTYFYLFNIVNLSVIIYQLSCVMFGQIFISDYLHTFISGIGQFVHSSKLFVNVSHFLLYKYMLIKTITKLLYYCITCILKVKIHVCVSFTVVIEADLIINYLWIVRHIIFF